VAGIWYEGRLAGVIGYHALDWENRTTEVGYWLGEEQQGKGLVTAACRALVDHAFGELGLNRVVISCATENKKSCAIPERLGLGERAFSARLSGSTITLLIMWSTRLSRASGGRSAPSFPN
jgi:RimJ/RimL family protein N-acetyltransferase